MAGVLLFASAALGGCGVDCDCPERQTWRVASRTWEGASDASVTSSGQDAGAPLPYRDEPTTMVVDRAAGVVTFTRQLPGGVVVERWRIRSAQIQ